MEGTDETEASHCKNVLRKERIYAQQFLCIIFQSTLPFSIGQEGIITRESK